MRMHACRKFSPGMQLFTQLALYPHTSLSLYCYTLFQSCHGLEFFPFHSCLCHEILWHIYSILKTNRKKNSSDVFKQCKNNWCFLLIRKSGNCAKKNGCHLLRVSDQQRLGFTSCFLHSTSFTNLDPINIFRKLKSVLVAYINLKRTLLVCLQTTH